MSCQAFQVNSLGGDDGVPFFETTCPLRATWAWISSPDPFRTFLLGFPKPPLYSHIPFALMQKGVIDFQIAFNHCAKLEQCC
jgi:hypothetical protein